MFMDNKYLLKLFLQEMLRYRLGTVNDLHWGFKPVLTCLVNLTQSHVTFIGEVK